eukprot:TRINITY_DN6507_c0_g1_i1.p1 TRINITY_DN6507_c0_g1~~TRINITY_DN6507_c0_g1_i1.p1  ORF type:complete len:413 (+),score=140.43 TRINITY_DN6507_c0_g1_i1:95-1240(+)
MSGAARRIEVLREHLDRAQDDDDTASRQSAGTPGSSPKGHMSSFHKWGGHKPTSPFLRQKTVSLVGAPLAEGQEIGGVEKGPQALRRGGLPAVASELGWRFEDAGDVDVQAAMAAAPKGPAVKGVQNCRRLGCALRAIHQAVAAEARKGNFVLSVGGDHSIASATISGVRAAHPDLCLVWVDAHGDCNTPETSPSAHYHGMPAAHVMGMFGRRKGTQLPCFEWLTPELMINPQRCAFIGLRDLDEKEIAIMRDSGLNVWTMHEVDKWGIGQVMDMALHRINPKRDRPVHLSFDIDGCDPSIAPGTGTCSRGGLSYRESHYIAESIAMTQCLVGMDLVEVNPDLDVKIEGRQHGDDPRIMADQMTVRLGLELIASGLGKGVH